ncbi:MAG: hypothetical protein KME40_11975 [Komarekiella atlantica HA4396-MV6]|nr:hypothetical protein [Komarekiella atlantica HA4396-MV6]
MPIGHSELSYIPKELKIKFKTICAKQDTTMSQVVKEFIEKWVIEND